MTSFSMKRHFEKNDMSRHTKNEKKDMVFRFLILQLRMRSPLFELQTRMFASLRSLLHLLSAKTLAGLRL